jgi:hypothetical protein
MSGGLLYWRPNQALRLSRHLSLLRPHQLHPTPLPRLSHPQNLAQLLAILLRPNRAFHQACPFYRLLGQKLIEDWIVLFLRMCPVKRSVWGLPLPRVWNHHLFHLLLLPCHLLMHRDPVMQHPKPRPPSSYVRLQVHLLLYLLPLRHHRLPQQRHRA